METNPLRLSDIIRQCTAPDSSERESGWRNFMGRYKMTIYRSVMRRCLNWQVSRLHRQLSDTVNDIVSEVFIILYHSLGDYRETDNEKKFLLWLKTICNRTASRHLTRQYISKMAEPDWNDIDNLLQNIDPDARWELYDHIVNLLSSQSGSHKRFIERDIHIFQLYVWLDCSTEMILAHPCLSALGHRVVDNVVNRLREVLKKK
jgi:DNA-directed RNA polymerase specialized sigma24 family protein